MKKILLVILLCLILPSFVFAKYDEGANSADRVRVKNLDGYFAGDNVEDVLREIGEAGYLTDAPFDSKNYVRKDGSWVEGSSLQGEVGPQGPAGPAGNNGENGLDGDDGYTPIKGVDYFDGEDGAAGAKGDKGDKGDQGDAASPLNIYPIGSIYLSVVSTDPGTLFGGTWEAIGAGRVLVGINAGDTDFDTVEETGGAKTVASAGTVSQPTFTGNQGTTSQADAGATARGSTTSTLTLKAHTHTLTPAGTVSRPTFTGNSTSIVQPYLVVYMWKRTA